MHPREPHGLQPPAPLLGYYRPAPVRGRTSLHWTGILVVVLILVLPLLVATFLFVWFR